MDGAHLRYRIEGHGPPCLVAGTSIYYPRVFSQELHEHLQLAFADLRHFAISDPSFSPDRISIQTYADDIERIRQALELGDVIVIRQSIHGTIALEYARRYPEHVRGVVAVAAVPVGTDENAAAGDRLWEAEASQERKEILARRLAELTPEVRATLCPAEMSIREYGNTWRTGRCIGMTPPTMHPGCGKGAPDTPISERLFGELFKTYDLAQGPAEITAPALITHGRYDYVVPYTLWEEHKHKLPRHTYALLQRSGHTPPLEEPEQFDQTLLAWVRGLQSPGG